MAAPKRPKNVGVNVAPLENLPETAEKEPKTTEKASEMA
jgi:hypothetical protein